MRDEEKKKIMEEFERTQRGELDPEYYGVITDYLEFIGISKNEFKKIIKADKLTIRGNTLSLIQNNLRITSNTRSFIYPRVMVGVKNDDGKFEMINYKDYHIESMRAIERNDKEENRRTIISITHVSVLKKFLEIMEHKAVFGIKFNPITNLADDRITKA
jgi:hypothetical protein